MITQTRSDTLNILERWLLELESNKGLDNIDPDTDLIEGGLIDSLEFVNFLYIIEEQRGSEIPSSVLQFEKFKTLNLILENFFLIMPGS